MGNIKTKLEYIWLGGLYTTPMCKVKVVNNFNGTLEECTEWHSDGSSTNQTLGSDSDVILKPVRLYKNPFMDNSYLVLCQVYYKGLPHAANTRHRLEGFLSQFTKQELSIFDPWFGFEQEYTIYKGYHPLGIEDNKWSSDKEEYFLNDLGKEVADKHLDMCIDAGINIVGMNNSGRTMLGQWEYQIGESNPLHIADDLWVSRWILSKVCSKYKYWVSYNPRPIEDDEFSGVGCHTNFSTKNMRNENGYEIILQAIEKLKKKHKEHIKVYGEFNEKRLTGNWDTSDINEFTWGVADRYSSVRIPRSVYDNKKGYLEDRRPSANCDPYIVCLRILETIIGK